MILKRFYDEKLAHASYLVGCPGAGEAIIIDPNRDIESYVEAAAVEGLRITVVTETHIHADYVSGSRELANRTGAKLYLSALGGPDWSYAFADEPNVRLVRDGDRFGVGALELEVVHTPGHTPEHITFVLTDKAAGDLPYCAFTGDFIFAGDVGRPDLLERAAGFEGTMEAGAKVLFQSLQAFKSRPASLILWPAHGAGSACGKSLGGTPTTTLGYEMAANWALKMNSPDDFVAEVLAGQPDPPAYFASMKRINKVGPDFLQTLHAPPRLPGDQIVEKMTAGAVIVDLRPAEASAARYIPGALNVPFGKGTSTWVGTLVPVEAEVYFIAESHEIALQARRDLAQIGFDRVNGWFGPEALNSVAASLESIQQVRATEIPAILNEGKETVIDVRGISENLAAHIDGVTSMPLGRLARLAADLPRDKELVVHCASGARSQIAISLLRKLGFTKLKNVTGGIAAYRAAGLPTV